MNETVWNWNITLQFYRVSLITTKHHKAPQSTTKQRKAKFVIQQQRVLGTLNCKTIFQGLIGVYSWGGEGMWMMTSSTHFYKQILKVSISYDSCKNAIKHFPNFDGHCQSRRFDIITPPQLSGFEFAKTQLLIFNH